MLSDMRTLGLDSLLAARAKLTTKREAAWEAYQAWSYAQVTHDKQWITRRNYLRIKWSKLQGQVEDIDRLLRCRH
jgi:hypothetical protein